MRPLRNLMLVEKLPDLGCVISEDGETVTLGGIIVPTTFKARGPSQRIAAKKDFWRARVVAIGPEVREVAVGDHVLIDTWAEKADGTHAGLYTGIDVGDGRRLVAYPNDIICGLDEGPITERSPETPATLPERHAYDVEPDPFPSVPA